MRAIELPMLMKGPSTTRQSDTDERLDTVTPAGGRIRCPLCDWQPPPTSRWCCICRGTPEPFFEGCGTVWNTFDTGGRCPGCAHQWVWTTCLRCGAASPHQEWYEKGAGK